MILEAPPPLPPLVKFCTVRTLLLPYVDRKRRTRGWKLRPPSNKTTENFPDSINQPSDTAHHTLTHRTPERTPQSDTGPARQDTTVKTQDSQTGPRTVRHRTPGQDPAVRHRTPDRTPQSDTGPRTGPRSQTQDLRRGPRSRTQDPGEDPAVRHRTAGQDATVKTQDPRTRLRTVGHRTPGQDPAQSDTGQPDRTPQSDTGQPDRTPQSDTGLPDRTPHSRTQDNQTGPRRVGHIRHPAGCICMQGQTLVRC